MFDSINDPNQILKRKDQLVGSTNQQYQELLDQLSRQQEMTQKQYDTSILNQNNQLQAARDMATQQALGQENQARQTYGDLITQARERARGMGGVTGSGVLNMYGGIDRNLQQNLYNIGQGRSQDINKAKLQADQQIAQLQAEYDKQVFQINNDRTKSLREKNEALQNIEMQAMSKIDAIKKARAAQAAYQAWLNQQNQQSNPGQFEINVGDVLGDSTQKNQSNSPTPQPTNVTGAAPFYSVYGTNIGSISDLGQKDENGNPIYY